MPDKARLGFIGVGVMGTDLLKEAVKNPRAEIAAVCDKDAAAVEKAREIAGGEARGFAEYGELLAAGGVDGVVVAVPQYAHAEVSIAALEAGVATFCEKPMAMNVAECDAMIAAGKRSGAPLMIGQVLRYIHAYRYVLEVTQSGRLGAARAVRMTRTMGPWKAPWARPWRLTREGCGGTLFEVNVHEIDLMACILGEPVEVQAMGGRLIETEIEYEDFITGQVRFKSGAIGSLTSANCDALGKNSGEIHFEGGSVYYESLLGEVHIQPKDSVKEVRSFADIDAGYEESGTYREMREFIETCLGERAPTIPGDDGLRAVEVAQAMYGSAAERKPVALPLTRA